MATKSPGLATWKMSASSYHRDTDTNLSILAQSQAGDTLIQLCIHELVKSLESHSQTIAPAVCDLASISDAKKLGVGLAALDIFLQANVTGPVVPAGKLALVQSRFGKAWNAVRSASSTDGSAASARLHKAALDDLEVDGVSPYSHIPFLELFSLAKFVFEKCLSTVASITVQAQSKGMENDTVKYSISWIRLRINVWHYKLLTQPSLGPGSNFTKSSQWSEVPSLITSILNNMTTVRAQIAENEMWSEAEAWNREDKAYFFLEAANNYILLGRHYEAKEALHEATTLTGLAYALSGALGKRTKFQENSISQLVVLARSRDNDYIAAAGSYGSGKDEEKENAKPDALQLNDDTLLEEIQFLKNNVQDEAKKKELPPNLADLSPDNQPQLAALDQIILLIEATLKDAFSPSDALTSQEILPYAVRVLSDESTNWQIYTQALLVRSRIEVHRSRTVERGVLQLQAVADQVLTDTTTRLRPEPEPESESNRVIELESDVPRIQITTPGQNQENKPATIPTASKSKVPTSFLPAPKSHESAPAHIRLRYIDALSTPPRWHLESELAYAWAGVGSLTSALEIFKRLCLWAEVALCYASATASENEDGRGSGGEEKARAIIRWRLFHPKGEEASTKSDPDDQDVDDAVRLRAGHYQGPERIPAPPNAARLWCILGDIENEPSHYERAWAISKKRYSRAQKSLGEYYLSRKDIPKAQEAYRLATSVNRLSPDLWNRLGDISLQLGQFDEAAEAYRRSISSATDTLGGEGARTWSNLGTALWSLYREVTADQNGSKDKESNSTIAARANDDEEDDTIVEAGDKCSDPAMLLSRSLAAFKKGASIAHDNWRIWDNVLTLAARLEPPSIPDMILALTHILRIRKSEDAIDTSILTALIQDVVLSKEKVSSATTVYEPPRGSAERLVTRLVEEEIVPLITQRPELWSLASHLRAWRRDYAGAIEASERAWRAAVGSSGSGGGLLPGEAGSTSADWTLDQTAWDGVVKHTDELVSMLENWGPNVESIGTRWKSKARSAIRSVMGRAKENWEGSEGWITLQALIDGLRSAK